MDYEEKYKSALKWMQSLYGGLHGATKEEAEKYFPELKESEDEKIRKEFCKDIWTFIPGEKANKYIAWLEKQTNTSNKEYVFRPLAGDTIEKAAEKAVELGGKVVLAFNGAYIPVDNKTKDEIVAEYLNWVKKQGERKSAKLDEADEKIRKELIGIYSVGAKVNAKTGDILDRDIVAWLEKQGEQHPHVDVNKMVDKFAHTEVKGHGVPSMIEVDAYRRGIEDALKYCLTTIQIYERDKNSKTT